MHDAMRKVKAHSELNLLKDIKANKKGFFRYINNKRVLKKMYVPLLSGNRDLLQEKLQKRLKY